MNGYHKLHIIKLINIRIMLGMNNQPVIFKIKNSLKALFLNVNNFFTLNYSDYIWWCSILLLFILAAFRPLGIDGDSQGYADAIEQCVASNFSIMDFSRFEPSFYFIIVLSKLLFHDTVRGVFIIYAFFALLIKAVAIQKLLGRSFLALFVYICLFYVLHELTQMRAAVAISIFLLSLPDVINRKPIAFYFKVLCAVFFHYSALLMVPLYFFNKRSSIFYFLPVMAIVCTLFIPYSIYNHYGAYIIESVSGILKTKLTNHLYFPANIIEENKLILFKLLFRYKLYVFFCMFIYAILFMEKKDIIYKIDNTGVLLINILALSITIYFFFFRFRVLSLRPSEFLLTILIILIPYISERFVNKQYQKMFTLFMIIVCSAILIGDRLYFSHLVHFEILLK